MVTSVMKDETKTNLDSTTNLQAMINLQVMANSPFSFESLSDRLSTLDGKTFYFLCFMSGNMSPRVETFPQCKGHTWLSLCLSLLFLECLHHGTLVFITRYHMFISEDETLHLKEALFKSIRV
jgi:hypothetical protein